MNTDPLAIELPRPRTGLDAVYDGKVRELLKTYNHLESPSVFFQEACRRLPRSLWCRGQND